MAKSIYTYYKERLIEIGGNSKCLYLKSVVRKSAYDIGRILVGRDNKINEFTEFLRGSRDFPFSIISKAEKSAILSSIELSSGGRASDKPKTEGEIALAPEDKDQVLISEVNRLKELKRETEEIEKETGRYELYVGYPFVFGCIHHGSTKTLIKAPLMLFPVKIDIVDDHTAELRLNEAERVHINHALVFAYAQSKKLNVESLDLEYDTIGGIFKEPKDVIEYLGKAGIKIGYSESKNIFAYGKQKEPVTKAELSVRHAAVVARFPISNSIYNDYALLEKKHLSNEGVNELLRLNRGSRSAKATKKAREKEEKELKKSKIKNPFVSNSYVVKMPDFTQSEVVRKVGEKGNMVIYGPPGTGKSQTIVNIITDAICKQKSVLVVSQKKAALDVVYNRLGVLSEKAMYLTDEVKQKKSFYEKCRTAHDNTVGKVAASLEILQNEYNDKQATIDQEIGKLQSIQNTLTVPRLPFGMSLSEMYSSSYNIPTTSPDYALYQNLIRDDGIMRLNYKELSEALEAIQSQNLADMYYKFIQDKEKNPLIDNMRPELDIRTLSDVKGILEGIVRSKKGLFNTAKYPLYRQVLAYYPRIKDDDNIDRIIDLEMKMSKPRATERKRLRREMKADYLETISAIESFVKEYDCLNRVLTPDGYLAVIDNILRGNTAYIKLVYGALDNYIAIRDVDKLLRDLDANKLCLLNYAYSNCKSFSGYKDIISKIPELRIYHEVLRYESELAEDLSRIADFPNITSQIYKLKEDQLGVAYKLCTSKLSMEFDELKGTCKEYDDFYYQISKTQKYMPVRAMMEKYGRFIMTLFPCWLLSPENVSNLLPLEKDMFDIVIFDEASQVFIESTIPSIYRGRSIVIAGDDKQLRPSATFMKRYLGTDTEQEDDTVQAALEVESLLDLAVARYESANLSYHYRSRNQELIDFSNVAFYSSQLQVAPNISKNSKNRPIERYKVAGKWVDRKNTAEAKKVIELLKDIFENRRNNESIGVITFNSDQQACIADMIDKECQKDSKFRSDMTVESARVDNGEDCSIFIKNLENVQGDERDIIIFSIGYAENEQGKLYTNFGSLSAEGGENRLNVAITRAKSKIKVVTSIEPEDLKVDAAKNQGPRLLQKYLQYTRAVAEGKTEEVGAILAELSADRVRTHNRFSNVAEVEVQIKEKLEKAGYKVDIGLGNSESRISLAVYDTETDRYLVGVELDKDAFRASDSCLERDVYKPKFLEARGWTIIRIWCRDWWINPQKVIKTITSAADKAKKKAKQA